MSSTSTAEISDVELLLTVIVPRLSDIAEFTSDDIHVWAEAEGIDVHPNAMGRVVKQLEERRLVTITGRTIRSRRAAARGRKIRILLSRIYREPGLREKRARSLGRNRAKISDYTEDELRADLEFEQRRDGAGPFEPEAIEAGIAAFREARDG